MFWKFCFPPKQNIFPGFGGEMEKARISLLKTRNRTQMEAEQEEKKFCKAVSKFISSIPLLGKCYSLLAQCGDKAE